MTLYEWCLENAKQDLLKEWDYNKNKQYTPQTISRGTNVKVWWKCSICEYSYLQTVSGKTTKNYGCPNCSKNKRAIKYKNTMISRNGSLKEWAQKHKSLILEEWDYEKNDILPSEISPHSHKIVHWKCEKGHMYEQEISSKTTQNQNCPYCSNKKILSGFNDFKTWCFTNDRFDLINDWDYRKNDIAIDDVSFGSNKRVWWKCENGHSYQTQIKYKTSTHFNSCPECCKNRISFPQQALSFYLSQKIEIIENYSDEKLLQKELDIFIPSLKTAIEYDGSYWHKDIEKDLEKDVLCKENDILLIRIRENGCPKLESSKCIQLDSNSLKEFDKAITKIFHILNIEPPNINLDNDSLLIHAQMKRNFAENSLKNWCIKNKKEFILDEWDYQKNGSIKPENILFGSNIKVWWKCLKCNHSWRVSTNQRTYYGTGCPICNRKEAQNSTYKTILKEKGSFIDWCIQNEKEFLLEEWDCTKNKISPHELTRGSEQKIWWKCNKCGYTWQSVLKSRSYGTGCPNCALEISVQKTKHSKLKNGKNSLAVKYSELMSEWDFDKNIINPYEITPRTNQKVWWKCLKCGNEWETQIASRSAGRGCPKCAKQNVISKMRTNAAIKNSLYMFSSELANEWIDTLNMPYTPQNISAKSNLKAWWKCNKCGHEWQATIKNRSNGSGCPKCSKRGRKKQLP